jgi:hypothetical protein
MKKMNGYIEIIFKGYGQYQAVYTDGKNNTHTRTFTGSSFAGKDVSDCKYIIAHRERGYNSLYKAIRKFTLQND